LYIPGRIEEVEREEIEEVEKEEAERAKKEGRELPELKQKPMETAGEELELVAFPVRVSETSALKIADGKIEKRFFGLFGKKEHVKSIELKFEPIYRMKYDVEVRSGEFVARECFINSVSGEFIQFKDKKFVESNGAKLLWNAPLEEINLLRRIDAATRLGKKIIASEETEKNHALAVLVEKGLVERQSKEEKTFYSLAQGIDLPPEPMHALLQSLNSVPFAKTEALSIEQPSYSKDNAAKLLQKMFNNTRVKKIEEIYRPVFEATIESEEKKRLIKIDAMTGQIISLFS
jgi:uncharacterized membrane protein YkoI